jgi:PAS domain S-box-containing protein
MELIQKEKDALQAEKEKRQVLIRNTTVAGFCISLILIGIVYKSYAEKKRANEILSEQKEEIQAQADELEELSVVAQESTNAVAIFDKDGNFEWVNKGFVKLYEQNLEELLVKEGVNLFETVPNSYITSEGRKSMDSKEVQSILKTINESIKGKKTVRYEYYTVTKSGKQIIVQTTLTPILDAHGEMKKLISIDSDISQLKRAEKEILKQKDEIIEQSQELRKRNEEIEKQSDKLKQLYTEIKSISDNQEVIIEERTRRIKVQSEKIIQYAFMNAHNLRAPVARIMGLIMLINHDKSNVDINEMLGLIDREVNELDQVIKRINQVLADEGMTDGESEYVS